MVSIAFEYPFSKPVITVPSHADGYPQESPDYPMYLILDTETTGISPTDRLVSICWAFYDTAGVEIAVSYDVIVPDGFTIPLDATAIHGISTDHARQVGIPLATALQKLTSDISRFTPQLYVGHNVAFDRPIVLKEYQRLRCPENLSKLSTYCTMKVGTNICRLPSRGRPGFKWPKLEELHRHLFGRAHASAHDARGDVSATAKCFFELRRRGH